MMVNLPDLSDRENDGTLLRFILARNRRQVNLAKIEVDLLQFGAFCLSLKQCFDDKPAFCLLSEQDHGHTVESTLPFHDCQSRLFQDELRGFWHMPHRDQVAAYVPRMSLILYVLPAFMVSEVSYILAALQQEQSMNFRLLKELGVRLIRLSCLFVATPLLILHYAQVLPYRRNRSEISEWQKMADDEWLLWHKALWIPVGLLCILSPCRAIWYYMRWQSRNASFRLREPLLTSD
jgi:hypothetical protein